ncbi:hypothetical protein [Streptomyces sp. TRM68416]|uniref:hypothetical protein n=1 Tax=Streptomyces sp. TRM68416 TaxID=2758412 RepID=UPI001661B8CE|nr:hypothetical protein [Streptomyces sp. TRM68416]MBD0840629.1 hypothetical protein [Streptomyces sp. TRM68416]
MEPTPAERAWLDVFEELRECPDVELDMDNLEFQDGEPADADAAFALLAEREGVLLDPALEPCYLRFSDLAASWGAGMSDEDEDPLFAGEFDVIPLLRAIGDTAPLDRYPDPSPEDRQFLSELRDFDVHSLSGTGQVASLRIRPGIVHNPEIWFSDRSRGIHRLDLDLCGYLDALRVTKGTFGWQYLYADVSLAEDPFTGQARHLTEMLQVFPDLFPAHDYTDLRARLEHRL